MKPLNRNQLSTECQNALDEFENTYISEFESFGEKLQGITNQYLATGKETLHDSDIDTLLIILIETIFPYYKIIGRAANAAVNGFFTIFPGWLAVRVNVMFFKNILEKDPDLAERLYNEINIPVDEAPLIPESIVRIWTKTVARFAEELAKH